MKRMHSIGVLTAVLFLFVSSPVSAGENCSLLGGTCRDACGQSEQAESGAFEDCGEKQECCVIHDTAGDQPRCCIYSFDAKNYGPLNCGLPENNLCLKGSGSPRPCENLTSCKENNGLRSPR